MQRFRIGFLAVLLLAVTANSAAAGLLDTLFGTGSSTSRATEPLANAVERINALASTSELAPLAAAASHEGHWRLVNRAGETMTAANPDELARALNVLAPEMAANPKARLAFYLAEDTAFQHRALLKDLPKAQLHVVVGGDAYPLTQSGSGARARLFALVAPQLIVELKDRALFDEAMAVLSRPLQKARIRSIALEPGGPVTIASAPRLDPESKRPLTDAIDPDRLRHTLSNLRGQTALITGRVEGERLVFKPPSGADRSLLVTDLKAAAEAADVNLVILKSSSPRQPGARNWLWQRVEVANLESAIERGRLADFLTALGSDAGTMLVSATPEGASRTRLDIQPARDVGAATGSNPLTGVLNDLLSEVTAKVSIQGISASMLSAERQRELERRIVPFVPAILQFGYVTALLLGLVGWPVARLWWQRIWPPEAAAEYGNRFGFQAARAAREVAFGALFLPLAGPVAALMRPLSYLSKRGTSVA